MQSPRVTILLLLGWTLPLCAQQLSVQPGWTVQAEAGVDYDVNTGEIVATNGVVVRYGGVRLTAREATLNQVTGAVEARGRVEIAGQGRLWLGEEARFNFKTGQVEGENFRSSQPPFFVHGEVAVGNQTNNLYTLADTFVTTEDYAEPGTRVRAKLLTIMPDEYVEAKNAVLYVGKVPVFYFPRYRRSLKRHPNFWKIQPGYRSRFGPYLLTSYNWFWDERFDAAFHIDGYAKRGVGFGPDFNYHLPKFGEGAFRYYFINDSEPAEFGREVPVRENRQRIWFSHHGEIRTNLTVKAAVRYHNDTLVVRDFFESEYRENPQPPTFLEVNHAWNNWTLDLLAQPRVNQFFETVERLPDVKLSGLRQRVLDTPLFYESETSVGWYQRRFAYDLTNDYSAWRADSFHQVLYPLTFFDWLNLTPRVGGRLTHYGESDPFGRQTEEVDRAVFNTGAEASFKVSRVWPEAHNDFFQIKGVRHILQPSLNYVWVPRPSRVPQELPQFDYESPSTRLLPITFPDYNSIDSIDSQNVLRITLRNKLQTKRKEGIENFVHWALYTDWRLKPRSDQLTFSDIYSDLDLRPFSWLMLNSELRYGINEREWNEVNNSLTFLPNNVWSLTVGQRYLRDQPQYSADYGNNLYFATFYYRLNENWGARASLYYEADYGVIEEQQYTIYRDFRSWVGALTVRLRDSPLGGRTDLTIGFTFSTKSFPRFKVGDDRLYGDRLLGN